MAFLLSAGNGANGFPARLLGLGGSPWLLRLFSRGLREILQGIFLPGAQ